MILVTGGAGFIGGNFVLDWLAQSGEPVVNVDKLTYAGNLETLASLNSHPGHIFVQADIGDRTVLDALLATAQTHARSSISRLKAMWIAASTARKTSSRPTSWGLSGFWRLCGNIGLR
jgi:dTDP-D-glucose 4,6-dehydratase